MVVVYWLIKVIVGTLLVPLILVERLSSTAVEGAAYVLDLLDERIERRRP